MPSGTLSRGPPVRLTTRWSRPGQPGVEFGAILALAGRAAHLEAVRRPRGSVLPGRGPPVHHMPSYAPFRAFGAIIDPATPVFGNRPFIRPDLHLRASPRVGVGSPSASIEKGVAIAN